MKHWQKKNPVWYSSIQCIVILYNESNWSLRKWNLSFAEKVNTTEELTVECGPSMRQKTDMFRRKTCKIQGNISKHVNI